MSVQIYIKPDGRLSFNSEKNYKKVFIAFPVGVVPYEWIEYINLEGDGVELRSLFYCYFKGRRYWKKTLKRFLPFGYPYKKIVYYKKNDNYKKGEQPTDMEYTLVDKKISKK
ncbi:MAG: hypothetical protein KAT32_00640 [Candidatus Moranbacteria bacterium]|nr:hypothetical protein [Candidatus Moranbacteria bacterium]